MCKIYQYEKYAQNTIVIGSDFRYNNTKQKSSLVFENAKKTTSTEHKRRPKGFQG